MEWECLQPQPVLSFNIEILKSRLRLGWEFDPSLTHFVLQILLENVGWG